MLSSLSIENIAVIEKADLEFSSGFNVLTGETGAGKSIIIDAIGAVLGERTSKELVRSGAEFAKVSALFENISQKSINAIQSLGFEVEDNSILLNRKISVDGKSSCYISGKPITVSLLREIGRVLVNTHGQHENQTLLLPEKHVEYLDKLGNNEEIKLQYEQAYHEYCRIHREIKKLQTNEEDLERKIDLLTYQINEIDSVKPLPGEEAKLTEKCLFYKNNDQISSVFSKVAKSLGSDDESASVSQRLEDALNELKHIQNSLPSITAVIDRLYSTLSDFEEVYGEITTLKESLFFDEEEREAAESRLSDIHHLMSKYHKTEDELLLFADECRKELDSIEHADQRKAELEIELEKAQDVMVLFAERLTTARKKAADYFEKRVATELSYLDMPRVTLKVQMTETPLTINGAERIEFCISANPGEPARSIAKIASGGELSRIMLAIKAAMADVDDIDTLIFDEIDNGISGHAAQKVGNKLREIACSENKERQILCVTHLAQIAGQAHTHLLIQKSVKSDRTFTTVLPLDENGRRRELARIISGEVTASALDAADEMLSRYHADT